MTSDRYINRLNGLKTLQKPAEYSGLIADDMGLGKTLTILSAISGSLEKARKITDEALVKLELQPQNGKNAEYPSRSSLVIVSTPCKYRSVTRLGGSN